MRKAGWSAPLLLAACAAQQPEPVVHGVTPGHRCTTDATQAFVGQPGTAETEAAIRKASNAAVLRWAPPGVMLTMDYREDRVTVRLGPDNRVTAINCG
ncbi:I78 family peptidase inhibitor [Sphingomonas ginkgonis]|nr:I78 family peptidase inhibitor [Sphingomonas ginkgonis]